LRRDFTINAIYANEEGKIFDPLNGLLDLKNGKVKFIGSPEKRIQEDYLRILRYFRFFIQYNKIDFDQNTIQIIKQNINGLNKISNERIFVELKKILELKKVRELFTNKEFKQIILNIFPQFKYYERLEIIEKLDQKLRDKFDTNLILALLILDKSDNYEYFCHKYKTSNIIKKRFKNISKNFENLKSKEFYLEENIKRLVYSTNKDNVRDLLLFSVCLNNKVSISKKNELLNYVAVCKIPKFPISGDYLKKYGHESGKELGRKLKSLEEKWIKNNFVLDKKLLDKSLYKISRN
jgi:tRNA nucleotidyltransferase/poly(A) polymerase